MRILIVPNVGSGLRILVAIPAGWTMYSEFVKHMTQFATHDKHQVAVFHELSATRLDFSLSKIIALAKRYNPDVLLRFDADCIPGTDIGRVAELVRSDFRSGFDLVYSPTRAASMHIMSLLHDPVKCTECKAGKHIPPLGKCSESYFGALGFSAMSPRLVEAYRPHVIEYGPPPDATTGLRQVRYTCAKWSEVPETEPEVPEGWERKTELSEIDPELNTHTPMYVVNPPDNSEDSDMCFDIRENGFRIGVDTRLVGMHLHKRSAIPNWGSGSKDAEAYKNVTGQDA